MSIQGTGAFGHDCHFFEHTLINKPFQLVLDPGKSHYLAKSGSLFFIDTTLDTPMAATTTKGAYHHESIDSKIIEALQDEGIVMMSELQLLSRNSIESIKEGKAHFATHQSGIGVRYRRYLDQGVIDTIAKQKPMAGLGYKIPRLPGSVLEPNLSAYQGNSYTVLMDEKAAINEKYLARFVGDMESVLGSVSASSPELLSKSGMSGFQDLNTLGRRYGMHLKREIVLKEVLSVPFEDLKQDKGLISSTLVFDVTYKKAAQTQQAIRYKLR